MTTKERYDGVIAWFSEHMPVAESELHYTDPYQLLGGRDPFGAVYRQAGQHDYARPVRALPHAVRNGEGHGRGDLPLYPEHFLSEQQGPQPRGHARMLCEEFGGEVPSDLQQMQRLPGVGRKTANVLGAVLWQKEVMPVDTHVFRVSNRIGLTTNSKTPLQTELTLEKNIPSHLLPLAHHWLILHGRYVCMARSPKCGECGIAAWCRKYAADHRTKG